jgi:alpha/beta superfamily hydrolase
LFIVCADNDFASSIEAVEKGMQNIPDPKELEIFENCDHFYIDKEHIIANKVHEFFICNSIS